MGVPALFRWLSQKYPKIISQVAEDQPSIVNGVEVPVDISQKNPNLEEFDNLYLDMNGIVHPCSHPEDRPPPTTEEEMMIEIFKYTERLFNMTRPRKLLFLAVDGVAPRAKMNQQRSRRFRSAQEAKEKDEDKAELMKMIKAQRGESMDEETEAPKKTWDSNAITPGTPFMDNLALSLRYWCSYKSSTDPAWKKVKIIISDASVPGEGEHKIMEFIRSQRSSQHHDANTKHVICGLDADLIMLGLATHEPHFRVLREDVFFQESKARTCKLCGQKGHVAETCKGEAKTKEGEFGEKDKALADKPFIWLHVSVLREYLAAELYVPNQGFEFNLERALDDWVFMCFFVGNDFLPHLPSLDIREQGIDTLIAIWRDNLRSMGGYLTEDGRVNLERCQYILNGLAKQEDAIFRRRKETEERKEAGAKRRKLEEERRNGRHSTGVAGDSGRPPRRGSPDYGNAVNGSRKRGRASEPAIAPPDMQLFVPGKGYVTKEQRAVTHDMVVNRGAIYKADQENKSAAAVLKSKLFNSHKSQDQADESTNGEQSHDDQHTGMENEQADLNQQDNIDSGSKKRKADALEGDGAGTPGRKSPDVAEKTQAADDEPPPDTIRLWEDGYADRYYEQKFKVDPKDVAFRNKVANDYVEGLAWVLLYYFQGCPSWTWYYPHHYAPFAADFVDIDKLELEFRKGQPFRPFEQLMGVLPAASNHTIPEPFRSLMSDEDSDILDFYPVDFPIDLNGKKFAWQGVALLPFIDEKRLLKAMAERYPLLSEEDVARNEVGRDVLIISEGNKELYKEIIGNLYSKTQGLSKYELDSKMSDALAGKIERDESFIPHSILRYPLDGGLMPDLDDDRSLSVYYDMPKSIHLHKSMLLRGVNLPPPTLDETDIANVKNGAHRSGRSFGGAPLRGGFGNGRGRGRGDSHINYGSDRSFKRPDDRGFDRGNPFAAHIDPNFIPPPMAFNQGYPPPGHYDPYNQRPQPPPPPPPGQDRRYHSDPHRSYQNGYNQGPPPPGADYGFNNHQADPRGYYGGAPSGPPPLPPQRYGYQQNQNQNQRQGNQYNGYQNGNGYAHGNRQQHY